MAQIAKGTNGLDDDGNMQGHKDAEAFAIYAMGKLVSGPFEKVNLTHFSLATWVNTAFWYRGFLPRARDT